SDWLPYVAVDQAVFTERFRDPARLAKTLVLELGGTVIGDLMVAIESPWAQEEVKEQAADSQAELGWSIDPAVEGHGYATEAARALLRLCFEDLGLRRVTALCFADNTASWRLMERIGMRREIHTVADSLHRTRGWLDGLGYAILAEEWRASGRVA
ncbi:GNAT family N-acetyltransferase, partial [Nocardia salmonicida]|uniref:GNAT family N-acetyltransferase n=1 Tax=Nocardia salmonicida TaxID=53431 RepID=UPI0033D02C7B